VISWYKNWPSNNLIYTVLSKILRTDFFLNRRHRKTYTFFLKFIISLIGIYTGFYAVLQFVKTAKNSTFWIFFNSSITASLISATSAKWSTFNFIFKLGNRKLSGGDKSGQYRGVTKGCNIFLFQKVANICNFVGGRIIVQQERILRAERSWTNLLNALQEVIHYSFIKFCIYCFSLRYEFFVHYVLESRKNYQRALNAGPVELELLRPRGFLTNPFRTLSFCFGVMDKTPGLISRNNFVKKMFVCIAHRDNGCESCDLIFSLLRCQGRWNKTYTQLSLSQILFQNLGMFKDSAIILDAF